MSLLRSVIRKTVVDGLIALNIAGVGGDVWGNRSRSIQDKDLPAIRVYTDSESVRVENVALPVVNYIRTVDLVIEIVAEEAGFGAHELDDLDVIGEQVETWMFDREELPAAWLQARLVRCEQGVLDDGAKPIGGLRLTFEVEYRDTSPRTALTPDDFLLSGVDYDLAPADEAIDAQDEILLPQ